MSLAALLKRLVLLGCSVAEIQCLDGGSSARPKVDIVYIWSNGTINNNRVREWNELYFSLQLTLQNVANHGRIIVATSRGHIPYYHDWEQFKDVEFIDNRRFLPEKWHNTTNSVVIEWHLDKLMDSENLSDPIFFMNDDFFILKPIDIRPTGLHNMWCQEPFGKNVDFKAADNHALTFLAANRALKYRFPKFQPQNRMAHTPVYLWKSSLKAAKQTLSVESSFSVQRESYNVQFEYAVAMVEKLMNPATEFSNCSYHMLNMRGPIGRLVNTFHSIWNNFDGIYLCLNDDLQSRYLKTSGHVAIFRRAIHHFLKKYLITLN